MSDEFFDVYCLSCDSIYSSIHLSDLETCPVCKAKGQLYPVAPHNFLIFFDQRTGQPIIKEV